MQSAAFVRWPFPLTHDARHAPLSIQMKKMNPKFVADAKFSNIMGVQPVVSLELSECVWCV